MIRIPTPFQVGDVNIYILGDTLIDTGPKTDNTLAILKEIDLKSVKNVLITHGHVDHHGIAFHVKEISGCTVFVHKNDLTAVTEFKEKLQKNLEKYKEFLGQTGISQEFIRTFEKTYKLYELYGEDCEAEPLRDYFETERGSLRILNTPGHTSGSCCFLLGDILYSGDTLLPTISTNPSIHALFDEQCGLKAYEHSLQKILNLPIEEVLPGHGNPMRDHKKRIKEILKEHAARREKIMASLSKTPQSLVEITRKIFGEVSSSEVILALAECYDHLKGLEKEGIVEISGETPQPLNFHLGK